MSILCITIIEKENKAARHRCPTHSCKEDETICPTFCMLCWSNLGILGHAVSIYGMFSAFYLFKFCLSIMVQLKMSFLHEDFPILLLCIISSFKKYLLSVNCVRLNSRTRIIAVNKTTPPLSWSLYSKKRN